MLISDNLRSAICEQIGHELYNANLYLHICGFLKNKGLDNIASLFFNQHKEETEHAEEFFSLLTDLNGEVFIPEIDECTMPFGSIRDVADAFLSREILTTKSINELKRMAVEEDNPVVEEKMRDMISKQQKEYEEATLFMDRAELLPEWWQCSLWDIAGK